jgi:hypothetical protein
MNALMPSLRVRRRWCNGQAQARAIKLGLKLVPGQPVEFIVSVWNARSLAHRCSLPRPLNVGNWALAAASPLFSVRAEERLSGAKPVLSACLGRQSKGRVSKHRRIARNCPSRRHFAALGTSSGRTERENQSVPAWAFVSVRVSARKPPFRSRGRFNALKCGPLHPNQRVSPPWQRRGRSIGPLATGYRRSPRRALHSGWSPRAAAAASGQLTGWGHDRPASLAGRGA